MLHAVFDLFLASFSAAADIMGTTVFALLATIAIFLVTLFVLWCRSGRKAVIAHWKENVGIGAAVVIIFWLGLIAISGVRLIYVDHEALVFENIKLKGQIYRQETQTVSFKIGGMITTSVNGDSTRLQITLIVFNRGDPVTVHGWGILVHTSNGDFTGFQDFGDSRVNRSLDLPWIDDRLEAPINNDVEIPGLISFILPHVPQGQINGLIHDPQATITMANGRNLTGFGFKV